jgi:hypothetical protein
MKWVVLNQQEIAVLDEQDPSTRGDGGFQRLMVDLQNRLRRSTSELKLTDDDLQRIPQYAFDYKQGGWEDRLVRIFGRTLGPSLGRESRD